MKHIKFTIALIIFTLLTTLYRFIEWVQFVLGTIFYTYTMWGLRMALFNTVILIILLQFNWFQFICYYWYLGSFIAYLVWPKYRNIMEFTYNTLKEMQT